TARLASKEKAEAPQVTSPALLSRRIHAEQSGQPRSLPPQSPPAAQCARAGASRAGASSSALPCRTQTRFGSIPTGASRPETIRQEPKNASRPERGEKEIDIFRRKN